MLLLNLTVDNFGVFRGTHSFELAPQYYDEGSRHLTIFSGHNGAGKTTLFQAAMLALYGPLALGDRVSQKQYNNFILNRIHRNSHENRTTRDVSKLDSAVKLRLQYVQSGQLLHIQVERRWQHEGRNLQEKLTVHQNGKPPEVDPSDYQVWLNDLIPTGVGHLCFFDAEQLDALASIDQQNGILEDALERLLGIDLVQRLQTDMEQYSQRQGSLEKVEHLYTRVLEYRKAVDELDGQLDQSRKEIDEIGTDLVNCEAALAQQERRLAAEGGTYAARRPLLQSRLQAVKKEIDTVSSQIRDLAGDLLPFALVPELCTKLSRRLAHEIDMRRQQTAITLWHEKLPQIELTLIENEMWQELGIATDSRKILIERVMQVLRSAGGFEAPPKETAIHHLAEPEYERLQQWITQALQAIPQQIQDLGKRLRKLREEQRRIDADLQRAPDDDTLAPIHAEISRLRAMESEKQRRQNILNEKIGSLQFQRNEKFRLLERAVEQYEKARDVEKQLILAERTKLVLRTYRDVLTQQRLAMLEEALLRCFNRICRKEHLLSQVHINPDNFSVKLEGTDSITLDLNHFSAGERQLYALALLWSLRLVSGRQLPLAIDTPLARLDEMHRWRFVHDYMPQVSDQVLLFATDAELDDNLLAEIKPYVARIYRLHHDPNLGETITECDNMIASQGLSSPDLAEEKVNAYGV